MSHKGLGACKATHASRKAYILFYIEDLVIFGDKKAVADAVESLQELLLRVIGELSEGQEATFLGRRMRRTSTSVEMFMETTSYIDRILEQAGMKTCKAAPTPGTAALKKGKAELAEALSPEEHQQYRKLVGQLLWLCNLRMDIMCALKELSRALAAPTTDHWAKLRNLLRCLSGTKGYVQEICSKTSSVGEAFLVGCSHLLCG